MAENIVDQKLFLQQKILNHRNRIRQAKTLRYPGWERIASQLEAELRMAEADLEACRLTEEATQLTWHKPYVSQPIMQIQQQQQQGGLLRSSNACKRRNE